MRRISVISRLLAFLLVALIAVSPAAAAEVLQVRTASLLQVGDGNRTYTVQLACIEVEPAGESAAVDWLRQELPRRRRVNLRPVGRSEGQLLARVTPLGDDQDLSTGLVAAGFAGDRCPAESV